MLIGSGNLQQSTTQSWRLRSVPRPRRAPAGLSTGKPSRRLQHQGWMDPLMHRAPNQRAPRECEWKPVDPTACKPEISGTAEARVTAVCASRTGTLSKGRHLSSAGVAPLEPHRGGPILPLLTDGRTTDERTARGTDGASTLPQARGSGRGARSPPTGRHVAPLLTGEAFSWKARRVRGRSFHPGENSAHCDGAEGESR